MYERWHRWTSLIVTNEEVLEKYCHGRVCHRKGMNIMKHHIMKHESLWIRKIDYRWEYK